MISNVCLNWSGETRLFVNESARIIGVATMHGRPAVMLDTPDYAPRVLVKRRFFSAPITRLTDGEGWAYVGETQTDIGPRYVFDGGEV